MALLGASMPQAAFFGKLQMLTEDQSQLCTAIAIMFLVVVKMVQCVFGLERIESFSFNSMVRVIYFIFLRPEEGHR